MEKKDKVYEGVDVPVASLVAALQFPTGKESARKTMV
jgi:hypothetical protein